MRLLRCVVTLAFVIAAAPAWTAGISPVVPLADPDAAFRTTGGEAQPVAVNESDTSRLPAGSSPSLTPGAMPGPWMFDGVQVAMNDVAPMQMAQAAGSAGAAPLAVPAGNPWIFGTTLYLCPLQPRPQRWPDCPRRTTTRCSIPMSTSRI